MGDGPVIVLMKSGMISHVQAEWANAEEREWLERLIESFTVIRYDGRGSGMSDRDAIDFSIEAQLRDLGAVVGAVGFDRLTLFAEFFAGPVAITYAVRNPKADLRLVLWHSFASPSDYIKSAQGDALLALMERDWDLFTQTFAHARRGWGSGEAAQQFAELLRKSTTEEAMKKAMAQWRSSEYDVAELLPGVTAPALIMQRRSYLPASGVIEGETAMVNMARKLASGIPNARLTLVEGDTGSPASGDVDGVAAAIEEFVGVQVQSARTAAPQRAEKTDNLTARERDVLRLVALGESNKEIAGSLGLSVHTVERHLSNIYGKIEVRGRAEATAWALRNGVA
jgi:DNA-binding CsgD family transcriptional regulator/pimeloyl-ACP methyl ester carboxylesterase